MTATTARGARRPRYQDMTADQQAAQAQVAEADLQAFKARLYSLSKRLAPYFPKHYGEPVAYFAAVTDAARALPELMGCDLNSIAGCLVRTVQTGLVIGHTCYILPFWDRTKGKMLAQWVPHYKGLIELAYDSGVVCSISAYNVHEGEKFVPVLGTEPRIDHYPNPRARGPIVGAYATARLFSPFKMPPVVEIADISDIEAIRQKFSHRWKDGAMPAWYPQKTVLKRLCNRQLPLARKLRLAVAYDQPGTTLHTWDEAQAVIAAAPLAPGELEAMASDVPTGPAAMPTPADVALLSAPAVQGVPVPSRPRVAVATHGSREPERVLGWQGLDQEDHVCPF